MRRFSYNFIRSSEGVDSLIEKYSKIMVVCAKENWAINKYQYAIINEISEYISRLGTDDQKKYYCSLLADATKSTLTLIDNGYCGCYLALEGYFREQCKPLLNEEENYQSIEITDRDSGMYLTSPVR